MRLVELRVEPNCRLELPPCLLVLPAERDRDSARRMRLGELGVKFERLPARRIRRLEIGLAAVPVHVQEGTAVGDPGIPERVLRVALDRALEHAPGILDAGPAKLDRKSVV